MLLRHLGFLVACIVPGLVWAQSSPLLTAAPPCPVPAELAENAGVEYKPDAGSGVLPADINPTPPLSLDIPLGVPVSSLTNQSAADLSLSQVPVGEVNLRDGKIAQLDVLGQTALPTHQSSGCPAPTE